MNGIDPIGGIGSEPVALRMGLPRIASFDIASAPDFGQIMMAGLRSVDQKVASADALVRRFAVDDAVPVHQVTMALEEARMSVELAMQVRSRLVEGYREMMNMQL